LPDQNVNAWYPAGAILDRNQSSQGQTTTQNRPAQPRPPRTARQSNLLQSERAANVTTNPRTRRDALALKDARALGEKRIATGVWSDTVQPVVEQPLVLETGESLKDGTAEWYYTIERSENDPTKAFIVAKAILKDGYEMPADKARENVKKAADFLFDNPDDYELTGDLTAEPTAKTKNITTMENGERKVVPVLYYEDSVTFRQPIKLKNVDDFDILSETGYLINNIYYGYDQADFLSEGTRELDLLITVAMKNPSLKFEITAHTDERGTEAYNAALSQRRLETVSEYIRQRGLDMNRVIARAVGKTEPLFRNARNEEEHALNRRTTIRMFDPNIANQPQRLNNEVTENSPLNSRRTGLWFRVQVGAFREMPNHPLYYFRDHLNAAPGLNLVYYRDNDGLYKFTLGDFTNLEQARRLSQRILDAKKDAHIVAFMDGKNIPTAEAESIFKRQTVR
jgi:outer membrane protein OmpA-like peptidoglycan-associated protein